MSILPYEAMSVTELQFKTRGSHQLNNTRNAMGRRASAPSLRLGSELTLTINMSLQRCNSPKPFHPSGRRRLVRSQSDSIHSLGALRRNAFQELNYIHNTQDESKLPTIHERVQSDDLMETAPAGITNVSQRRSSCVLPGLLTEQGKTKLRVIPLKPEHLEKLSSNIDFLKSKSLNLAKWLQDQS